MELKDVILSTLAEMEEDIPSQAINNIATNYEVKETKSVLKEKRVFEPIKDEVFTNTMESEKLYLASIRERLLVLFEGFQAPNNKDIEAKVDMTLNFLEYVLATIDSRLEKIDKGE